MPKRSTPNTPTIALPPRSRSPAPTSKTSTDGSRSDDHPAIRPPPSHLRLSGTGRHAATAWRPGARRRRTGRRRPHRPTGLVSLRGARLPGAGSYHPALRHPRPPRRVVGAHPGGRAMSRRPPVTARMAAGALLALAILAAMAGVPEASAFLILGALAVIGMGPTEAQRDARRRNPRR